ncbi:MAG: hypothetical protein A2047_00955 [Omnitrophica bacterium GWA2_41_15]|nr:MAG: hypothetical protein A2047_00955 [Omnitrophica bacterium GWA2_41_15]
MSEIVPKWIMRRYLILRNEFGEKEFSFEECKNSLDEGDARIISIFLSDLKKNGWLTVKIDPNDSRKRLYQLRGLDTVFNEITKKIVRKH